MSAQQTRRSPECRWQILECFKDTPEAFVARVSLPGGGEGVLKRFPGGNQGDFQRELQCLRQVSSPAVTRILEAAAPAGEAPYLIREFVAGPTLRAALPDLSPAQRLRVFAAVLHGLRVLHRQGLFHGDLKPENVFVTGEDGFAARLSDFGLAGRAGVTASGITGSAYYLAPERLFGWPLDTRSDMFSLGVLLYELLGGELPHDPGDFYARFPRQSFLDCVPPLSAAPEVLSLIQRLCAVDPERRPADLAEVQSDLVGCRLPLEDLAEEPWRAALPVHLPFQRLREELERACDAGQFAVLAITVRNEEESSGLHREVALLAAARSAPLYVSPQFDELPERRSLALLATSVAPESIRELAQWRVRARGEPWICVLSQAPGEDLDADRWPWIHALGAPQLGATDVVAALTRSAERVVDLPLQRFAEELVRRSGGSLRRANRLLQRLGEHNLVARTSSGLRFQSLDLPWDRLEAQESGDPAQPLAPELERLWTLMRLAGTPVDPPLFQRLCSHLELSSLEAQAALRCSGRMELCAGRMETVGTGPEPAGDETGAHALLAELLADLPGREVLVLHHRVRAGQLPAAVAWLEEHEESLGRCSAELLPPILEELLARAPEGTLSPRASLLAARFLQNAGRLERSTEILRVLRTLRGTDEELRRETLRLLGDAWVRLSRLEAAQEVYQAGYRRTRGTAAEAPFVRGLADVYLRQAQPRAALSLLDAVGRHDASFAEGELLELEAQRALALLRLESCEEAAVVLRRAMGTARRLADDGALAMLLTNLALAERRLGKTQGAIDVTRQALALRERRGRLFQVAALHRNLGVYLKEALRFAEARHHFTAAEELHQALGDLRSVGVAAANLGLLALDQCLLEDARRHLQRASQRLDTHGEPRDRLYLSMAWLRLRYLAGQWQGLNAALERLRDDARHAGVKEVAAETALLRVERLLAGRQWERANQEIAEFDRSGWAAGDARWHQRIQWLRASFWRQVGEREAALDAVRRLQDLAQGTALGNELLLEEIALEGPPPPADLLEEAERCARATGNRAQLLEALTWRRYWYASRQDRHGVEATTRALREVLEEVTKGAGHWSPLRVLCAATSLRLRGHQGVRPRSGRGAAETGMSDNLELLRTSWGINKRLSLETDLPRLLEYMMDTALALSGAQRCFLILERQGETQYELSKSLRGEIEEPEKEMSHSFLREALSQGRPLITSNAGRDPRFRQRESVHALDLRSILCVPFRVDDSVQGALYLDNSLREGAFGDREVELIDALSDQAAIALRNLEARSRIEKLNHELERRVAVQSSELAVAWRTLEREGVGDAFPAQWVGGSPSFEAVTRLLERYAVTTLSVLVTGESGTGKELAARMLHRLSPRSEAAFVSESCSAIPESLLEAEFFGVRKGAFTGADRDRPGLFELAQGGTLFLDEVGDLPLPLQTKLLRALQERAVRPLGGSEAVAVDVRIVCATNRDLEAMIREGHFREDLYYRLAAARVRLPALRERGHDIGRLARRFLERLNQEYQRCLSLSAETVRAMEAYDWPGNVRQLQNEVQRCFAIAEGDTLHWAAPSEAFAGGGETGWPPQKLLTMREIERLAIEEALRQFQGSREEAARALGISRASIYEKLRRYGISAGRPRKKS